MSGLCSAHAGHDPDCRLCTSIPLTDEEKAYYRGWDERLEAVHRNGWAFAEAQCLDAYEALEKAVRADDKEAILDAIKHLDELRQLNRGFRA